MKCFLIIAATCLLVASCKKDRTCECKVEAYGFTTTVIKSEMAGIDTTIMVPLSNSNTTETELEKVSTRKAKFNCISRSESFKDSYPNGIPDVAEITITNQGTRKYDCELK